MPRATPVLPALGRLMGIGALAVSLGLGLSACQSQLMTTPKPSLNAPALGPDKPQDYGVVLGTVEPVPSAIGVVDERGEVAFEVELPGYLYTDTKGKVKRDFFLAEDLERAATPPGKYRLARYRLPSDRIIYRFPQRLPSDRIDPATAGKFKLRTGEVIYVGHLVFEPEGDLLRMSVEDRFEAYKASLPTPLAERVVKRLIKLPEIIEFPAEGQYAVERRTKFKQKNKTKKNDAPQRALKD